MIPKTRQQNATGECGGVVVRASD